MISSLVLVYALSGCCSPDPEQQIDRFFPPKPATKPNALQKTELERVQQGMKLMEENIEMFERLLRDHPEAFSARQTKHIRDAVTRLREQIAKDRQHELELLASGAGQATTPLAPMPHLPTAPLPHVK